MKNNGLIKQTLLVTLIKPARQCKSIPSGTTPVFSCSLTETSWLLSALILKIPSAFKKGRGSSIRGYVK